MLGSVYITSLCFNARIDRPSWNAVFWIIIVFVALSISLRNIGQQHTGYELYQYLIFNPLQYLIAKWSHQALFALAMNALTLMTYSVFMGFNVERLALFCLILAMNTLASTSVLVLTGSIAAYVSGGFSILSILSIPLLIPVYSISVKIGKQAMDGIENAAFRWDLLAVLGGLFLISFGLSVLLFPYLWRSR